MTSWIRRVSLGAASPPADDEGGPALEAEILPSDVALAPDGALIVSQTEPEPAVRRINLETGIITTLLR